MSLSLVVYYDEMNQIEFLAEVLANVLGYDTTQAMNCAHLIFNQGQYTVKKMKRSQLHKAKLLMNNLTANGIPAQLLRT